MTIRIHKLRGSTPMIHGNSSERHRAIPGRLATVAILSTFALLLPISSASAAPVTDPVPLSTLSANANSGAKTGTLANGVTWSVDKGYWAGEQGYATYPAGATAGGLSKGAQTWTFDRPVSLRFGLTGMNLAGECFLVPTEAVVESITPGHVWNPATRLVCAAAGAQADTTSYFTTPVTQELVLTPVGNVGGGRGVAPIEVTYDTPTANADTETTVQDEPVTFDPATNDTVTDGATLDATKTRLLDGNGDPVTTLTNADGTYTVDTATGEITFTPAAGFTGQAAPVTYRIEDSYGYQDQASITVTVGPVVGVPMMDGPIAMGLAGLLLLAGGAFAVRRRSNIESC